jgi:hypothetical protein
VIYKIITSAFERPDDEDDVQTEGEGEGPYAALLVEKEQLQEYIHTHRVVPRLINTMKATLHTNYESASDIGVQIRESARLLTLMCSQGLARPRNVERSVDALVDVCVEAFEIFTVCTPPCVALSELIHVLVVDGVGGKVALEKIKEVGLVEIMQRACTQQEMMGAEACNEQTMGALMGGITSFVRACSDE